MTWLPCPSVLSTAVAVMQLFEGGKLQFDEPVAQYLPAFAANGKGGITVRQLLTHYSGLREDVPLSDPWSGRDEGVRRAMDSIPYGPPGATFRYSDINYIALGALVERLSGEPLDVYAAKHIFAPLGMQHTGYRPGAALLPQIAPTAHNDDKAMTHDELLRGVVHDPTTRRMGGVAGHAGVFSTAQDTALFAQALLDRLAGRPEQLSTAHRDTAADVPTGATGGRQVAARLWMGYRFALFEASRRGVSGRQLRPHRLYGHVAVDGPAQRQLCDFCCQMRSIRAVGRRSQRCGGGWRPRPRGRCTQANRAR